MEETEGIARLQSALDSCCANDFGSNNNKTDLGSVYLPAHALTCCLLQVIGWEVDVMSLNVHVKYSLRPESQASVDFIEPEFNWTFSKLPFAGGGSSRGEQYRFPGGEERLYDDSYWNETFYAELWFRKPTWEVAVKSAAVTPVVLVALLGNIAVIRIIIKAKLYRNPINMFILNMSIADLMCALYFPWTILVYDFYQSFQLGEFICKTEGFLLLTLMLTSVLSLTAISYDRLKAVLWPFQKRMTRKRARRIIWCVWIIAASTSSPLIFWRAYHFRVWENFNEKWCVEFITNMSILKNYWLIVLILLVWIPLTVMTVSYAAIVYKLDSLEKRQKEHPAQVKNKSKVVRMLFAVVVIFAFCWTPFSVYIILRNNLQGATIPEYLRMMFFAAHYLMFINSAVNPIIYGLKNDNLKREIRLALPAWFRTKKREEISAVYTPEQRNGGGGKSTGETRSGGGSRPAYARGESWKDDDEESPASIVSVHRKLSALEDIGLKAEDLLVPRSRIVSFAD